MPIMYKKYVPKEAVDDYCGKIESSLKSGRFEGYCSGSEESFLYDIRRLFDRNVGNSSIGFVYSKCKELHQSPYVSYDDIGNHGCQSVELADIMFIITYYYGGSIASRQAHFSQSKCMKKQKEGYLYWEINSAQHELLEERPEFQIEKKGASAKHDLSGCNESLLNYSFASNFHRPFFYKAKDMEPMLDETYSTTRFYIGKNPPIGTRYLYPVTRQSLVQRYGSQFGKGDAVYDLVKSVYEFGKLTKTRSPNSLQGVTDGGNRSSGLTIVNIEVDGDKEVVGHDLADFDELDQETSSSIESAFAEQQEEELDFYAL